MIACTNNTGLTLDLSVAGGSDKEPVSACFTVDLSIAGGSSETPLTLSPDFGHMTVDLSIAGGSALEPVQGQLALPGQALEPTLMDIFTIPVAGDLQQMWMLGFGLPVIAYLAAWGYGVVINWFNENHH
jgi:hypothetical protein